MLNEACKNQICKYANQCGGCSYQGITYEEQLKKKQKAMKKLLGSFGKIQPIIGMESPYHYRNKVHHVFDHGKGGEILCGQYKRGTHKVIDIDHCMIEDEQAQKIISTIKGLMKSFKVRTYDEDTQRGTLRHVLIRKGYYTGEILVVLVLGSNIFPSKNNFCKELLKLHIEITTLVLNYNPKKTTFVLGEKEEVFYGPGFIYDEICGKKFRISPKSFFQINTLQTEILYKTAIDYAGLTGKETVIDAYCGTGTIGISAASYAKEVIGVELNSDAVKDARLNAKENQIKNVKFYNDDAGKHMVRMAKNHQSSDVVIMDPPRSGSDERFLSSVVELGPKKVVYVSCGPESLKRDLEYMTKHGYQVKKIQPVDMFPFTEHVENVALLCKA
ncbi:MAG: 23S rRNA (uracil(1939)-C(5))-methyltransferase RlmD [Dorea sp.]|nr:23S rRNA (uracil(1939)-C(5))-methyltransferase RlmD [Dorea sp.]